MPRQVMNLMNLKRKMMIRRNQKLNLKKLQKKVQKLKVQPLLRLMMIQVNLNLQKMSLLK